MGLGTTTPTYKLDVNTSITSRSTLNSPRFSSAGTYVYGVTNSPTWTQSCGSCTNNNVTAPDGTTSAGTYTLTATCGSYDLYQTISGLTNGRVYTIGMWVKLGTATNFCVVVNNTGAWNTIGGKAFTSSDGLSTSKWTHISYTFAATATGAINLHLGYHAETAVTQQTAGTVFLWNIEMTEFSSIWIGNVEDEIRLPGSSIWTSRGNVGIGTTSPATKLDVSGSISVRGTNVISTGADIFGGLNYDIYGNIRVLRSTSAQADGMYIGYGGAGGNLRFFSNSGTTEFMTIATTGNVGIGTTSPITKLDVRSGYITAGTGTSTSGTVIIGGYYSDGNLTVLGTEYSSGGPMLGYGVIPSTASAGAFFSSTGINVYRSAYIQDGGTHRWYTGGVQTVTVGSSVSISEKLRLNSDGNLGVGISNVTRKLLVNGDAAFAVNSGGLVIASYDGDTANIRPNVSNGSVLISDDSGLLTRGTEFLNAGGIIVQSISGYTPLQVKSDGNTLLFVASGGNIGIGTTSPAYKLDIVNAGITAARIQNTASTLDAYLITQNTLGSTFFGINSTGGYIYNSSAIPILFYTNGSERIRVTSDGNVGIGTTSPGDKLEVNGTTRTEKLRSNGICYVGITGAKSSNASSFNMFDINNTGGNQTIEIVLSHHHSGGGQHGSFRRVILALNSYVEFIVLEDTSTNFGGGLGFTITRTSASTIRIGWAGATAYATGYTFIGWIKGNGDYSVTNVAMDSLDAA